MIKKHHGGQDKAVNDARGELLGRIFSTRFWKRIERLDLQILQEGRNSLWMELEGPSITSCCRLKTRIQGRFKRSEVSTNHPRKSRGT